MIDIILIIIVILCIIISVYCITHKLQYDNEIKIQNEELQNTYNTLQKNIALEKSNSDALQREIDNKKEHLNTIQKELSNSFENQKRLSQEAFENYVSVLENQYKEAEEEHDMEIDALNTAYSNLQLKLMREADECRADLDKIRSTRAAAIEAQRREKELENNISFYCVPISDADKSDIAKLENLKPSLNKPRVLSMLIWQTWFQKPLKSLSANVVGISDKTGIYKITNIKTKECYIGQAVSIKDRWTDHVKCGLGIDTPAGNKLYKAMQEDGIWNFAFEVLEECPREQLNEKEKYYINLYNSYEFGYNSNRGNK